jgi:hypothetical protein
VQSRQVPETLAVDIRAKFDQQTDSRGVLLHARALQGRDTIRRGAIRVRTRLHEQRDDLPCDWRGARLSIWGSAPLLLCSSYAFLMRDKMSDQGMCEQLQTHATM